MTFCSLVYQWIDRPVDQACQEPARNDVISFLVVESGFGDPERTKTG